MLEDLKKGEGPLAKKGQMVTLFMLSLTLQNFFNRRAWRKTGRSGNLAFSKFLNNNKKKKPTLLWPTDLLSC